MPQNLTPQTLVMGERYNWKHQPERLVYVGRTQDHQGCRGWYRFAKVEQPERVWCEVRPEDLQMMEKTV
jgi:hypothetical protein